jgi:hypothetical protein
MRWQRIGRSYQTLILKRQANTQSYMSETEQMPRHMMPPLLPMYGRESHVWEYLTVLAFVF